MSPSSGSNNKRVRNQREAGGKQMPSKRRLTFKDLPSVVSQKIERITTAVRTSSNAVRDLSAYSDFMVSRELKQQKNKLKSTILWDVTP
jgi:hypothetical protein